MEPQEKIITDLKIYNPNDFPFGPLSNIANHEMIINSKRWPTVENYILSNMLITPLYRLALQTAPIKGKTRKTNIEEKLKQIVARIKTLQKRNINTEELENIRKLIVDELDMQRMDIRSLYNYYLRMEYINNMRTSTEKAYNAKISENKDLEEALLRTENRPIIYHSNNDILGIGKENNGLNFIGKTLMQIRNNIRNKFIVQEKEQRELEIENKIFDAYKTLIIVKKLLVEGNDLKTYIGKTPQQVIEYYLKTHESENLDTLGIGENMRNLVMDMYKRRQLPIVEIEIQYPGYIILSARKEKLQHIKERLEREKANIILNAYTRHIIKKNYPNMKEEDMQKAAEQLLLVAPTPEKYIELRNKIVQLYLQGKLDLEIKELVNFPNITEQEIQEAEDMATEKEQEIEEDSKSSNGSNDPIKQVFNTDDRKERKYYLIQALKKYSGFSEKIYKDFSITQLQDELRNYEEGRKQPEKTKGKWIVRIKHTNNTTEIIYAKSGLRPSPQDISKILEEYNKNRQRPVKSTQIKVIWDGNVDSQPEDEEEQQEKKVTFSEQVFIKYIGNPVEIYTNPDHNSPDLKELSPIFNKTFFVDGYSYPSVAIYNIASLLTHTGSSIDMKDRDINKRGTPISKARELLIKNKEFVTIEEANQIYINLDFQTHKNLEEIYARIGMAKKFEDPGLLELLSLTGNRNLIYTDPNDNVLGGEGNIVGQILTEIRLENPPTYFTKIPDEISEVIFSDSFLKSWLQMRLSDICSIISKMQKYLLDVGKQPEDINDKFVTFVINLIYKSCSSLLTLDIDDKPPPLKEEFINMVKGCELFPQKLSRDYEQEIEEIRKEKDEYINNFYNVITVKQNNYKQTLSGEKFAKLMEIFLKSIPPPTEEQIEKYQESLLTEFKRDLSSEKVKESFEERQKEEWLEFLEDLLKPKKPYSEIYDIMNNLKHTHQQQIYKLTNEEDIKTAEKEFRKLREKQWLELTQPASDEGGINKRNEKIFEFNKKQENDRLRYYGISESKPKTKEDLDKYNDDMKKFAENINKIKGQQKDELNHIKFVIQDVSHILWKYISNMIKILINSIKNPTHQSIRKAIINAEFLISDKNTCENIPVNLTDPFDNCITSAIANILSGIESFKYQYADTIPLGTYDIDLATSIIIGREPKPDKEPDQEPEQREHLQARENNDENQDDEDENESNIPEEQNQAEELEPDEKEFDYEDENEDLLENEDNPEEQGEFLEDENPFEFSRFGVKKWNKKLKEPKDYEEQIKMILQQITRVQSEIPNIDKLVKHFLKAIKTIKNSKLSEKVKINRINFFATLKV